MRHYVDYVLNASGVPISGATVDVRVANASPGSGALATIYSDDGVTAISNPVTTDSTGTFAFYVADGRYDLVAKVGGVISRIVADIEIADVTQSASGDAAFNIRTLAVSGAASVGGGLTVVGPFTPAPVLVSPPGNQTITNGDLTLAGGSLFISGNLTVSGLSNLNGGGVFSGLWNKKNISDASILVLENIGTNNGQLIGMQVEQFVNPSVSPASYFCFGQVTELLVPIGNATVFSGQYTGTYGTFSHFGSGSISVGFGGAFEGFNPGPATALLIGGVNATANNGGVVTGVPIGNQTPTNNGNATNLRAFDGLVKNWSSGTVTNGAAFYAEAPSNIGGGVIVNAYGLLVADMTAATNNFAISTGSGKIFFGDAVTMNSTASITGTVGIGVTPQSGTGLLIFQPAIVGATQIGIQSAIQTTSACTGEGAGGVFRADTPNVAFSQTLNVGVHVQTPTRGAASTITEWNGLKIDAGPTAGTKFAIKTIGTEACSLGGALAIAGQLTSTLATGTAPLVIASTTNIPNLNASSLNGATFAAPGAIGSGTPSTGAFTTLSATGQVTSTLATGTAPLVIASTTVVPNLNVQVINGVTISGAASAGQAIVATSSSAAAWTNVPARAAAIDTTGLTANVAAATLLASGSVAGGQYQIACYVVETTAGSVSSTLPNVQIIYTDPDTNTSITIDATPILGIAGIGQTGALTANTIGTASAGVITINAKAATVIQYQTVNYASTAAGMTYALHIKISAL